MSDDMIELPRDVVLAWRGHQMAERFNTTVVALAAAIDAALWEPPVATIPWVSVEDHPHPTDGMKFLAKHQAGFIDLRKPTLSHDSITHWCLLPEGDR